MFPKLLRPFDYLRIKHDIKERYDFLFPFSISAAFTVIFFSLPVTPQIFGSEGLISNVISTIQILTGFYIASLAAIATFNKDGLDDVMKGTPPTLSSTIKGKKANVALTRRKFLCLLFGYLSLTSIMINLMSICAKLVYPSLLALHLSPELFFLIKYFSIIIYFFVIANLFVTTLIGLYYMSDRIHRYEPKLIKPQRDNESNDENSA